MIKLKNPERFESVGNFSEGYALAKLSDGRGYAIIDEYGDITQMIDRNGKKVDSVISGDFVEGTFDNVHFENGSITYREKGEPVINPIERKTYNYTYTMQATKSGYQIVKDVDTYISGDVDVNENTHERRVRRDLLGELFLDPEKFLQLVPGEDFESLNELRAYLDVVQHSLELSAKKVYDGDKKIKDIDRLVKKIVKKFEKWKTLYSSKSKENLIGTISAMGE